MSSVYDVIDRETAEPKSFAVYQAAIPKTIREMGCGRHQFRRLGEVYGCRFCVIAIAPGHPHYAAVEAAYQWRQVAR